MPFCFHGGINSEDAHDIPEINHVVWVKSCLELGLPGGMLKGCK